MKTVLFKLYWDKEFVGYEMWEEAFRWSYSPPKTMGARGWNGMYIPHNNKKICFNGIKE